MSTVGGLTDVGQPRAVSFGQLTPAAILRDDRFRRVPQDEAEWMATASTGRSVAWPREETAGSGRLEGRGVR
ncbi:protein of unknown function [Bradyrhizobium vignae]|uniref:Uncharacterized protein n=1 Tax=Bradyrhizobium vignae TaxID=1549949 RepID=A0A2U3Q812_9BRAD|nr:protein of unknown function [Bradyrhizobium vignae]